MNTSYPLNLASAVVLPLQGVWNAVIFMATTWVVLKEEVGALWKRSRVGWWWERRRRERAARGMKMMGGEGMGMGMGGGGGVDGMMGGQRGVRLGSDGLPSPHHHIAGAGVGAVGIDGLGGTAGRKANGGYKAWRNGNGAYGYGVPPIIKDDFETRSCGSSSGGKKKAKKGPMDPNRLGTVRVIRGGSL